MSFTFYVGVMCFMLAALTTVKGADTTPATTGILIFLGLVLMVVGIGSKENR